MKQPSIRTTLKPRQKKISDPAGKIECRKCHTIYPRNAKYFHKNQRDSYGFCRICKDCNNKIRTENDKAKTYHNVHMSCKNCSKFYYASRANLNKVKKRLKNNKCLNASHFCSSPCFLAYKEKFKNKFWGWKGKRRGVNNPTSIYTEKVIRKVKKDILKGLSNVEISLKHNVSQSVVSAIKTKRAWTHIKI